MQLDQPTDQLLTTASQPTLSELPCTRQCARTRLYVCMCVCARACACTRKMYHIRATRFTPSLSLEGETNRYIKRAVDSTINYLHIHICAHTCVYRYTYTYIYAFTPTLMHTYTYTRICIYVDARKHVHMAHVRRYAHTEAYVVERMQDKFAYQLVHTWRFDVPRRGVKDSERQRMTKQKHASLLRVHFSFYNSNLLHRLVVFYNTTCTWSTWYLLLLLHVYTYTFITYQKTHSRNLPITPFPIKISYSLQRVIKYHYKFSIVFSY